LKQTSGDLGFFYREITSCLPYDLITKHSSIQLFNSFPTEKRIQFTNESFHARDMVVTMQRKKVNIKNVFCLFFVLEQIETSSVLKCIYFFGSLWSDSTKNPFQKMSVYFIIQLCFVSNDIKTKGVPLLKRAAAFSYFPTTTTKRFLFGGFLSLSLPPHWNCLLLFFVVIWSWLGSLRTLFMSACIQSIKL